MRAGGSVDSITLAIRPTHIAKVRRRVSYHFFVMVSLLAILLMDLVDGQKAAATRNFRRKEWQESDSTRRNDSPSQSTLTEDAHHHLNTTLCKDDVCSNSCISYMTPLGECYNPQKMFPGDPSWGESDALDNDVTFTNGQVTFQRTFYSSNDTTCTGTPEAETLPLNECIGPFGAPRPWGSFELL